MAGAREHEGLAVHEHRAAAAVRARVPPASLRPRGPPRFFLAAVAAAAAAAAAVAARELGHVARSLLLALPGSRRTGAAARACATSETADIGSQWVQPPKHGDPILTHLRDVAAAAAVVAARRSPRRRRARETLRSHRAPPHSSAPC
jgi:hypothetical protein